MYFYICLTGVYVLCVHIMLCIYVCVNRYEFILQKIVNHFFSSNSSREVGTLANYKAVLYRTNVNWQVKSTNGFEPHKDFVYTVAR